MKISNRATNYDSKKRKMMLQK